MNPEIYTGKTDITPEEARFNPRQITRLDRFFSSHVDRKNLQCAGYILAREGRIFAHKTMGRLLKENKKKPFLPDSIRGIASVTKVFTTIGIMQLVEQGKIWLEQSVGTILPLFDTDMHRGILIKHLLTHTSGLNPDFGYFNEPYPDYDENEDPSSWSIDDFIRLVLSGPTLLPPGTQWTYSSDGFILLGEIINRVSGMPYNEYITKHILAPLGMKDTCFTVPEEKKGRLCLIENFDKELALGNKYSLFAPGGGLHSTLQDILLLGEVIRNKGTVNGVRILGRKTVETMCRNQLVDTPAYCWGRDFKEWHYGLGIDISQGNMVSPGTLNHEGSGRCGLYIDPSEDFTAFYIVGIGDNWIAEVMENPRSIIWTGIE